MRNFFLILFTNFFALTAFSQQNSISKLDSLRTVLSSAKEDTTRVNLLLELANLKKCADTVRLNSAKNALAVSEKISWQKGKMLAYKVMGSILEDRFKNYPEAIKNYNESIGIATELDDTITQSYVYNSIGHIYQNTNEPASAIRYYRKSIELYPNPSPYGNSGIVYNSLGDYQRALECYEQALILTQRLMSSKSSTRNDSLSWVGLILAIGDVYVSMSQYDNALENYNSALKIIDGLRKTEAVQSGYLEIWALTEIGKVYKVKKDFPRAIQYFEQGLNASNNINEHDFKPSILNEIGNVYLETGDLSKALTFSEHSLTIIEKENNLQLLPKTYTTLGKIYAAMKKYPNATSYLSKALNISKKTGSMTDERDAWFALSSTYEKMNQTDKAFDAFKHFIALRDSVYNVDKAKEMVRIDLKSQFGREHLADSVKQDEEKKVYHLSLQRQRTFTYGGFGGLLLVLLLSFFIYRNYSQQKKANKIISKANASIQKEKQVSETLLLNILPEEVAQELKDAGKVHAKLYDQVTVMFTDFVNFTEAGGRLSPQQLVAELDACFQAFDEIIGKYNIEKIKTVGDAYLCVSGLPHANPNHAANIVSAAVEIRDFMIKRKEELGDMTFGIRIGINSGNVVAGIVGIKKFAYDIWGDTVNIAARMEQNSEPGKVNISESTYLLLKGAFTCQYRGKIQAKNKGVIDMYFVN
jgi:adenylate cyclase